MLRDRRPTPASGRSAAPARQRARLRLALRLGTIRGAWWAIRAQRTAWHQLRRTGLGGLRLPPPRDLSDAAGVGVSAVLARTHGTCLTQALVRQAWLAAQGSPRDLVIGVRRDGGAEGFLAHAWLDGEPPPNDAGYLELARHRPRTIIG